MGSCVGTQMEKLDGCIGGLKNMGDMGRYNNMQWDGCCTVNMSDNYDCMR